MRNTLLLILLLIIYGSKSILAQVPSTVTTQAVTDILQTTATGNGDVIDLGTPNPTQHGICWNTAGSPTLGDSYTNEGGVSSTGSFTSSITGLNANTTYYVRAYVTNAAGTTYGAVVSFTTLPNPPTCTTVSATSITSSGVTLNGTVNANNGVTVITFEYGLDDSYGITETADESPLSGSTNTSVSKAISGLDTYVTYHYRVVGTNSGGTTYGIDNTFTTSATLTTVTTLAVTDVSITSAIGNGNITAMGVPDPTAHGVCWNTTGNPTLNDNYKDNGAASSTGAFTSDITGLSPNTTYYVRAFVTNAAGTTYGTVVSFTTLEAPTIITNDVISITQTTAVGNGNITNLGAPNPTQYGVCWSTSENPTTSDSKTEEGVVSSTGAFTSNIIGLSVYTTYYVRAYATNATGTVYGNQVSFKTLASLTTVTTQAVSDISTKTATGNGTITAMGIPDPTAHGVCWNTTGSPTLSDSYSNEGGVSSTGAFTSALTELNYNTTYYVRAYVTNEAGTTYGTVVSFTTLESPPSCLTNEATDITDSEATLNGVVEANDYTTTITFEYGLTASYGTTVTAEESPVSGDFNSSVSKSISGLSPNTTYHYRIVGENSIGTDYGMDMSFKTSPIAPVVTTQELTEITQTTATGNGNIVNLGNPNPSQYGVCWNTIENPTTTDNKTEDGVASVTGAFTSGINGLSAYTIYYVRAYATNDAGTVYGDQVSFRTLALLPNIINQEATGIEARTVTLNAVVNANQVTTDVNFEYGLTDSYGETVVVDQGSIAGNSNQDVSKTITSLRPNETYHFRTVAVNEGGTAYGDNVSFATNKLAQVITFDALSEKTTDDVNFNPGAISSLGLEILYSSNNTDVATIVDNQIHITGAGTTDITAAQQGNDTVYAAAPVTQTLTVTNANGIDDLKAINIKMYPNPVSNVLSIEFENLSLLSDVVVSIIDLNGRTVLNDRVEDANYSIDVNELTDGLYFVEIKSIGFVRKVKLIKK